MLETCNETKISSCLSQKEFCVCEVILQHQLFQGIERVEVHNINSFSSLKKYESQENIFLNYSNQQYIYFVLKGAVRLYSEDPETNKEYIHRLCYAGSALNAETLLGHKTKFNCIAQCLEESLILVIEKNSLYQYMHTRPAIILNLARFLSDAIIDTEDRAKSFVLEELNERLIHFLSNEAKKSNSKTISLSIPKAELAYYLGTIPSTLSKAFAKLEQNGVIQIDKNIIRLLS